MAQVTFTKKYVTCYLQYSGLTIFQFLILNVPGDCGSSRPTRVGPRLHCVAIAWQVRGTWVGSAAHSPLHAIAARALSAAHAIEPRPTHFACVRALGVPRTHSAAHALCVGPRILRGPAHFEWARAFCSPRTWRPMHWCPVPLNFQPIQFAIQANHGQYHLKPIHVLTQGQNRVNHATNLSKQQPYRRVSNLVAFQNFAKYIKLHLLTINPKYTIISFKSIIMLILITWYLLCVTWFSFSCYTMVVLDAAFGARKYAPNAGNFLPNTHNRCPIILP